jgi:hypothetical protein
MEPLDDDLVVRLTFEQDEAIESSLITDTLVAAEAAIRDVAVAELHAFRHDHEGSAPAEVLVATDAALERLRRFDGALLRIIRAENGSLVLEALLLSAAYWLLQQTVSESVKQGWKDSDAHSHLSAWFRRMFDEAPDRFADVVTKRLRRKGYDADVKLLKPEAPRTIDVTVREKKGRRETPPTYGQVRRRLQSRSQ